MLSYECQSECAYFIDDSSICHDCFTSDADEVYFVHDDGNSAVNNYFTWETHFLTFLSNFLACVTWVCFSCDNVNFNTLICYMLKNIKYRVTIAVDQNCHAFTETINRMLSNNLLLQHGMMRQLNALNLYLLLDVFYRAIQVNFKSHSLVNPR